MEPRFLLTHGRRFFLPNGKIKEDIITVQTRKGNRGLQAPMLLMN